MNKYNIYILIIIIVCIIFAIASVLFLLKMGNYLNIVLLPITFYYVNEKPKNWFVSFWAFFVTLIL
jgi:hypothetical protein